MRKWLDRLNLGHPPAPANSSDAHRLRWLWDALEGIAGPMVGGLRFASTRAAVLLFVSTISLVSLAGQSSASGASEVQKHLERGQADLKANSPATAAKEFREVLALDPKNAEAYADLGVITYFQGDFRNAAVYLRKALSLNPSLAKTQALLGICETRMGDSSGVALLAKAFPKVKEKSLRVQVGLELAGIYYRQGSLDGAAAVVSSLVDLAPDNVEVLYTAQRVYYDLADDTLNKLAILAPGSARMQEVMAERLVNDGDLKGAIQYYEKTLQIAPRLPGVHFELGEAFFETSPKDAAAQSAAEKEFETAIKVDGDSPSVECRLGEIAILQADLKTADARFERAFALDPGYAEAQLGLGKVMMSEGKPQEAVKYLRMAVQSDPLNGEARYQLGMAYRDLKMPDESRHELKLFQEIKEAKAQVRKLYRQINKNTRALDEEMSGTTK